jgi:hypothetical protein
MFEEAYLSVGRKNFMTLLYGIVGLPGWPSGSGGGLQTRSTWVRFPPPAPRSKLADFFGHFLLLKIFGSILACTNSDLSLHKSASFSYGGGDF